VKEKDNELIKENYYEGERMKKERRMNE